MTQSLDILAIAAHRDDVEQTCGGTLLAHAARGLRCGILDLSRGELGTRGTAADRARESGAAARILQVAWRAALDIPDGRVENTFDNRLKIARVLRATRPRVVILPYWQGRHPDHYTSSQLGYEACFAAGLKKLAIGAAAASELEITVNELSEVGPRPPSAGPRRNAADDDRRPATDDPHRPYKILYASLYADVRPTFVIDITSHFEARTQALFAYKSQYRDQSEGAGLFPAHAEIRTRLEAMAGFYGLLAGVRYAEPFVQKEVGLVDDVMAIPVASI